MVASGLLLVDKPAGFTSHDVVAKCRKILGTRKIGHAGTLDPMATGLLVLGVEAGTKLLTFIVGADKTYEATIRLGSVTVTDDVEGQVIFSATKEDILKVSDEHIYSEIQKLTGTIMQQPSAVSAIKVAGVRSYDRVRAGENVELSSREVTVIRFEVIGSIKHSADYIDFAVVVDCSSGTYIRALARDLGRALGIGGHLTSLRRTRIGNFDVSEAQTLEELATDQPAQLAMLTAAAKALPVMAITDAQATDLRHGKRIAGKVSQPTAVYAGSNLVAVVESAPEDKLKSLVVFSEGTND